MIEYKVREVTRYIVTRFEDSGRIGGSSLIGEFDNSDEAYKVGAALAFKEREDLGWPPGDERMRFPDRYRSEA